MHNEKYPVVFIGATVLACAAAEELARAGRRCLVVDAGVLPGYDFAAALKGRANVYGYKSDIPEVMDFYNELVGRDIIGGEGVGASLPALEPVLAGRLAKLDGVCDFLFMSRVIALTREGKIFRLKLYTTGGTLEVTADKVVDTTGAGRIITKSLNVNLSVPPEAALPDDMVRGRFADEVYLRYTVGRDTGYNDARRSLIAAWGARPDLRRDWKLALIPSVFDVTAEDGLTEPAEGFYSLPSAQRRFGSFMDAYEAGVKFARGDMK